MPDDYAAEAPPPMPDQVQTTSELAAALTRLRGARSYSELDRAVRPRKLARSTLSDMLSGKTVPGRDTLLLFLTACELDESAHPPWLAAWERVCTAGLPRPPGAVRVREADPRRLGVHDSIQIDPAASDLPIYVPRDLDRDLRTQLAAASNGGGGFVLLVGDSSVGKTRALVEAVQAVMPEWWLVHPDPTEPPTLADLAATPLLRTVIWLDEFQRYLTAPGGLPAGRVRALLEAGAVLVATLWPSEYGPRTTPPPPNTGSLGTRHRDPHSNDRQVLDLASVLSVAGEFSTAEIARANVLADTDPRIRTALAMPDVGFTQVLAAGPQLIRGWIHAFDPYGKAVITAALDARRVGAVTPLTREFLEAAAPIYLTSVQRATAPSDWLDRGLAYATTVLRGATAPLSPVATMMGRIAGYTSADYLHQHARRVRRAQPVPDQVWQALINHHPYDHVELGGNAQRRARAPFAEVFYRRAALAGDRYAARLVCKMVAEQGREDDALSMLCQRVDVGDEYAVEWLVKLLVMQGRGGEATSALRQRVEAGDEDVRDSLIELAAAQGRADDLVFALRPRANAGDLNAVDRLAGALSAQGYVDEAIALILQRADAGSETAACQLGEVLAQHDRVDDAISVLRPHADAGGRSARYRLAEILAATGRIDDLRARAGDGDQPAGYRLVDLLTKQGGVDELRGRADDGDEYALDRLLFLLTRRGNFDAAISLLFDHVDDGDPYVERLSSLLVDRGRLDDAVSVLRSCYARGGMVLYSLVDLLVKQGEANVAISILRPHVDGGDEEAADRMHELLAEQGHCSEGISVSASHADQCGAESSRCSVEVSSAYSQLAELRQRVDGGDRVAAYTLSRLLINQGCGEDAISILRPLADEGEIDAAHMLVQYLTSSGRVADLKDEVNAGTYGANDCLIGLEDSAGGLNRPPVSRWWFC